MKRTVSLLLSCVLLLGLLGCSTDMKTIHIALITGEESGFTILERQTAEGIGEFAKENNLRYSHYICPADDKKASVESVLQTAVAEGAKIIVFAGNGVKIDVSPMKKYPDVRFLLVDTSFQGQKNETVPENMHAVVFDDMQKGFLAGYSLVKEGKKSIAFLGSEGNRKALLLCQGFLEGANLAAAESKAEDIQLLCCLGVESDASPQTESIASGWFRNGVEVVFAPQRGVAYSVLAAAGKNEKKVFAADCLLSATDKGYIASVENMPKDYIKRVLACYEREDCPEEKNIELGFADNAVGFSESIFGYEHFSRKDADALILSLAEEENGVIREMKKHPLKNADELYTRKFSSLKIEYIR